MSHKRHGCYNTMRRYTYKVQAGWKENGTRHMIIVEDRSSRECRYDNNLIDVKCEGCEKILTEKENTDE